MAPIFLRQKTMDGHLVVLHKSYMCCKDLHSNGTRIIEFPCVDSHLLWNVQYVVYNEFEVDHLFLRLLGADSMQIMKHERAQINPEASLNDYSRCSM